MEPEIVLPIVPEISISPQPAQRSTDSKKDLSWQIHEKYDLYAKAWCMLWFLIYTGTEIGLYSILRAVGVDSFGIFVAFGILVAVITVAILFIGLWLVGRNKYKELDDNKIPYMF